MLDREIISLMVEPIKAKFGVTDFQVSLLMGPAFGIFYTVLGIPLGWAADRYKSVGTGDDRYPQTALWISETGAAERLMPRRLRRSMYRPRHHRSFGHSLGMDRTKPDKVPCWRIYVSARNGAAKRNYPQAEATEVRNIISVYCN